MYYIRAVSFTHSNKNLEWKQWVLNYSRGYQIYQIEIVDCIKGKENSDASVINQ